MMTGRWNLALCVLAFAGLSRIAAAASCESLSSLALPGATITSAALVGAGEFKAPPAAGRDEDEADASGDSPFKDVPAFCRVAITVKPSADSDIKVEVWLPVAGWNGNYQGVGNGGWAGTLRYADMAKGVRRGYATASTDTGHSSRGASFALGHPEKLIDFGYRAEHEMTLKAKPIITAMYGRGPKLSYFIGCSSGGRMSLMEAQRFPEDYDGIVAGSPTNNWTNMMFGRMWVAHATLKDPASYIPPAKYAVIHKAALAACDAMDGVKDGLIRDPTRCKFDPKILECKAGDAPDCLTAPQVQAALMIYAPARNPRTGEEIFPPMMPGSELSWGTLARGPQPISLANDHFKYVVFDDPKWDFKTLNFDTDLDRARQRDDGILTAVNPDLRPFASRGGKLIQYHGWTDQQVQPLNSVNYYLAATKAMGSPAKTTDFYRLFMAPGMNHCGGGEGPNTFDMLTAIEQWREQGKAPDQIIASHVKAGSVDRTRPLCPYPQVAKYKGSGSTDEAASFTCAAP